MVSSVSRRAFIRYGIAVTGTMLAPPLVAQQRKLKLVYFNNYPPFSWQDKNNAMKGMLIDTLTEVLQNRMGIPVSHEGHPWKRAQELVKQGTADAFCTVPTEARSKYTQISKKPVIISPFKIYTRSDHPQLEYLKLVKTLPELKNYTIGHFIGGGWAKRNLAGLNVEWAPTLDNTLQMLAHGRVDVHVSSAQVTRYNLRKLGLSDKVIELPATVASNPFHLCIGNHSPFIDVLDEFDTTISLMKEQGKLLIIQKRY